MEPKVFSYAGMLDQSGFKQWYHYLKLRISRQFEATEVSFLMSKSPFYFKDYEMLETGSKLTFEDHNRLSEIFGGPKPEQLDLDKDDYGTFEKRIVRVRQVESLSGIDYHITIPWTVKGKSDTVKLKLREEKRIITIEEENELLQFIESAVNKLIILGFFRSGRLTLDIYRQVEERCQCLQHLRPAYVKQILYQRLNAGNLTLKAKNGHLYYAALIQK